jgi:hypothetical protein
LIKNDANKKGKKMIKLKARPIFLKALGTTCGVTLCLVIFIPLFTALFLSVYLIIPIPHVAGKLQLLLVDSIPVILGSLACGVSGFLMGLVVIFISKSKEIKIVVFAAIIAVIALVTVEYYMGFVVGDKFASINFSQQPSIFFKARWLLDMILEAMFLLGFAVVGARLITRRRLAKA